VHGAIWRSDIRSAGSMRSVKATALVDSRIFAGVSDPTTTLPISAADLTGDVLIGSVVISGNRTLPFAVQNSDVAAATINNVIFGRLVVYPTSIDG